MPYDTALMTIYTMQDEVARLVRTIVAALNMETVDPYEGMQVGMQAVATAASMMALLQGLSQETRAEIVTLLAEGHWTMGPQGDTEEADDGATHRDACAVSA